MTQIPLEFQLIGVTFAALLGLAFGSFLNVCVARWPEGESVATPRSHCRNCSHTLAWWENLPLVSWIILRGRCRRCQTRISFRYPLVEITIAGLWVLIWLKFAWPLMPEGFFSGGVLNLIANTWITLIGYALLNWLLVALAVLDAEYFWLPDRLTLPGIALGFVFTFRKVWSPFSLETAPTHIALHSIYAILAAAGIILIIRLAYWIVRRKEGMGLGDAKLMAMLGAWLGLIGALESFVLAIAAATIAALIWLVIKAFRGKSESWAQMPLPLGTFLCLAALSEIFNPEWLWTWYSRVFLP